MASVAGLAATPTWARDSVEWGETQFSWTHPKVTVERALSFRHRHTDETLNTVYYANGRYLPQALDEVNWLLRDFRTSEIKPIDPQLLDLLYAVRQRLESNESFDVFSGYRSPETNALLRREGWGVARNSLHMQGMAIDIGLPGMETRHIANCALSLQRGGVGIYRRYNFVHLDTGRVRTWRG
ncbi:MAG: DUF882 domain-containing protein [Rhodospirillales bacterium]|nr:DUF882 domain-containing protein [Rhodospirillales bacterium]